MLVRSFVLIFSIVASCVALDISVGSGSRFAGIPPPPNRGGSGLYSVSFNVPPVQFTPVCYGEGRQPSDPDVVNSQSSPYIYRCYGNSGFGVTLLAEFPTVVTLRVLGSFLIVFFKFF